MRWAKRPARWPPQDARLRGPGGQGGGPRKEAEANKEEQSKAKEKREREGDRMVTAASAQDTGKLTGKDFIFVALFGLLLFVVFFVFAMILGMNANTFWFTHALGAIPGGIVWMYLVARVPKPGAIAAASVIVAVVGLLLGMFWAGPAGIVVGGVLADAIISLGRRSNAKSIAAFAVWTLCFWLGQQSMVFFAGDAYVDMVVQSGMSAEYGQALVGFMQSPLIVVAGIACVVGAVVGGVLGAKLFRKHFSKLAA